jgi:hypothetical protein
MNQRLAPIILLSILTACAGNSVKDSESIQQSAIQQAKAIDQDPQSVIAESLNLQIEAQKQDLYFFSPTYMRQAEEALEDAEDATNAKKQPHEIIAHALTAQKLFKRGLENKPTVLKQLKATFDGIAMLQDIETDKILSPDFQDIQDDTKDLIILIEQGKTTEAINEQKDILIDIAELEIKTLKKVYFTPAENALDKAEDTGAEDFASKSFTQAQKAIETFEKFIETSAKQREAIKEKSKLTVHLAQHAENIAKAAQPLLKLTHETAEDHILFIEKLLNRIATALNQGDILNLNLNSQSIAIAQTAEITNKRANTQVKASEQSASWKTEKAELLKTIEALKGEQSTLEEKGTPIQNKADNTATPEESMIKDATIEATDSIKRALTPKDKETEAAPLLPPTEAVNKSEAKLETEQTTEKTPSTSQPEKITNEIAPATATDTVSSKEAAPEEDIKQESSTDTSNTEETPDN